MLGAGLFAPGSVFAGSCNFRCISVGELVRSSSAAGITSPAHPSCDTDAQCVSACNTLCPIPGTGDGQNGIAGSSGTGLVCNVNPSQQPVCVGGATTPATPTPAPTPAPRTGPDPFRSSTPGFTPPVETTKACTFRCVPRTDLSATPTIGDVHVTCTEDSDCQDACNRRCTSYGPEGNGLGAAAGANMVCATNPRPQCVTAGPPGSGMNTASTSPGRNTTPAEELFNPLGEKDVLRIAGRVVQAIFGILGSLALLWFLWGGVLWMTAMESKRTQEAMSVIKNASLGILLLVFSYALATGFLGIFQQAAGGSTNNATRNAARNTTNAIR